MTMPDIEPRLHSSFGHHVWNALIAALIVGSFVLQYGKETQHTKDFEGQVQLEIQRIKEDIKELKGKQENHAYTIVRLENELPHIRKDLDAILESVENLETHWVRKK